MVPRVLTVRAMGCHAAPHATHEHTNDMAVERAYLGRGAQGGPYNTPLPRAVRRGTENDPRYPFLLQSAFVIVYTTYPHRADGQCRAHTCVHKQLYQSQQDTHIPTWQVAQHRITRVCHTRTHTRCHVHQKEWVCVACVCVCVCVCVSPENEQAGTSRCVGADRQRVPGAVRCGAVRCQPRQ